MKNETTTYRILIVDDNPAIHEDFRKIIETTRQNPSALGAAETALFGDQPVQDDFPRLELDSAFQGQEALERVIKARQEGRPYAMAFVDIRMPPGWDGIETIGHLWKEDPDLQIVICTAYSDYSWEDMRKRLGRTDKLLILKKPFDNIEARQFACSLTEKWSLTQRVRDHLKDLERLVAERTASLENSLSLTKATLESTADGILMVSNEGVLLSHNRRFLDMWKIAPGASVGWNYDKFVEFSSQQLSEPQEFCRRVREIQSQADGDSFDELEFSDGRIFERYSVPQRLNGVSAGRVFSFRDVTKHQALENLLRQSQKMESIGRLAGGVAHDFNNILTVISGYGNLILTQTKQEDVHKNVEEILKASDRAAALTSRLLAFSRKQAMQLRIVDLNALITDLSKMLGRLIGEDIELITAARAGLWPVKVDAGQIEQVLLNLAVNARDAMPRGGKLTIDTSNVTLTRDMSLPAELLPGDYVLISVTDTGTGMTEEIQRHLFEPFFTTKGIGKGTGLGLASCHGVVKQSGGHISASSELGHGSVFKIYLPRVRKSSSAVIKPETPAASPHGSETILLVEDEPAVRALAGVMLRDLGYAVSEASNGREALRVVAQGKGGAFDLLVTDMIMPEMGGQQLAEKLKVSHPKTKVLFCSGYTNDAFTDNGVLPPDILFLQKPYTLNGLACKVREVLNN